MSLYVLICLERGHVNGTRSCARALAHVALRSHHVYTPLAFILCFISLTLQTRQADPGQHRQARLAPAGARRAHITLMYSLPSGLGGFQFRRAKGVEREGGVRRFCATNPSCSKLPWLPLLHMATVGAAHECTSQYTQFQSVGIGCSVNTAWQPLVYHSESCTNKRLEVLRI